MTFSDKKEPDFMTKRILSCLMTAFWTLCLICVPAQATQSRAAKFLRTYELSGDGAADVVSVALAQLGRTGAQLDYSEEWCADFVADCARLAGQSRAIPAHGNVYGLRSLILGAGGTITTSDPQPGDICFIDWDGDENLDHVEIVYKVSGGGIYTIGGNSGLETGSPTTRYVNKHTPLYKQYIAQILRPNYSGSAPADTSTEETVPDGTVSTVPSGWYEENPVFRFSPEYNSRAEMRCFEYLPQ